MRRTCEEFFAARLPIAGLAAFAARLPDGTVLQQCFGRRLLPTDIHQVITRLDQRLEPTRFEQAEPVRMVWVFEHLRVHFNVRPDSAWLALFLENRPELPWAQIESVLCDFAGLRAS